MTLHAEPDDTLDSPRNRFFVVTEAATLLFLGSCPIGIIGYGAWWLMQAIMVGITRILH